MANQSALALLEAALAAVNDAVGEVSSDRDALVDALKDARTAMQAAAQQLTDTLADIRAATADPADVDMTELEWAVAALESTAGELEDAADSVGATLGEVPAGLEDGQEVSPHA